MEGWIKLHRKLQDWEWYSDSNMIHLFIHLLINANNEPGRWRGIDIKRGQLVTGRKAISEKTGISERSIRTCLNRLKSTNEVTIKTTNKNSIITITNYDDYQIREIKNDQQNDQQPDQQPTSKRPANDHKQEYKKEKNNNIYTHIPPIFNDIKLRVSERNLINVNPEAFFAHYESNGWMVGNRKMKNWDAALTYWEHNNIKHNGAIRQNHPGQFKNVNDSWK